MKSLIFAVLATVAFAAPQALAEGELQPGHVARKIRIDTVQTTVEGAPWPQTVVKVTATFGNACVVPHADELVLISDYQDNYDTLDLTVASISDRMCTMEYAPVTVTINLGAFVRPNDGLFETIKVNGIVAQ